MKCVSKHVLFSLFVTLLLGPSAGPGAEDEAVAPSVGLWDTAATATESLSSASLKSPTGWKPVAEDNVSHLFSGDAVVRNDRLIVVVRKRGAGAEVYSQTATGLKPRVSLEPQAGSRGGGALSLGRLQILENSPAAVLLAANYKTAAGGDCSLKYRLTAGQATVEVQPGVGTDRLLVRGESRYAVIPDFFGDDMVFPAERLGRPSLRLPTENFFLSFMDRGGAQLMCVWQSSQQGVLAIQSPRAATSIAGYEVQAAQGKTIWVAILEGQQLWHERTVSADDARQDLALTWKPPFPAKWRADLLSADGPARCWYFPSREDAAETSGPPSKTSGPCCFIDDRAVVRLLGEGAAEPVGRYPTSLLVYALDRTRATPLDSYCPIDVLRNTLGVGPCQYILQTEGLASESNPTPDNVMTWVEKQFQRKKEKKARDEIEDLLGQMADHVQHAQTRIDRYAGLAREVQAVYRAGAPGPQDMAKSLLPIADRLEQAAKAAGAASGAPQRAKASADAIGALIGKDDALADCQRLGAEVRALGAVQDRALANCRMTVRWLKQSAAMIVEDHAAGSELAKQILVKAEQGLQTK